MLDERRGYDSFIAQQFTPERRVKTLTRRLRRQIITSANDKGGQCIVSVTSLMPIPKGSACVHIRRTACEELQGKTSPPRDPLGKQAVDEVVEELRELGWNVQLEHLSCGWQVNLVVSGARAPRSLMSCDWCTVL